MRRVVSWMGGSSIPVLIGAATLAVVSAQAASAAEPRVAVAVSAGAMDRALMSLATQAKVRILFESQLVAGRTAPAVRGQFTAREALERLLAGSNIEILQARPGVLVLRPTRIAISNPSAASPQDSAVTAAMAGAMEDPPQAAPPGDLAIVAEPATTVAEIIVGSHIRGVKDGPSPVIVIGREEIDRGGYATIADALSALPQAFGGSASDDARTTATDPTTTNDTRATGFNLRGLGADATLVLINGRRMAGSGLMGDFADVSSIPLAAVARIEVLLDGASALYGSDAVGGVVNIVMRDRYDGAETRARIGGSTRGDLGQRQIAQTFGRAWRSGSVMVSGEYQRRDRLRAIDRSFTGNADLRALGGSDRRLQFSQPGNVLGVDPVTRQTVPMWAIPAGQDGTALRPGDFLAGQINLQNYRATLDILPTQERGSLYAALIQDLGTRVTLSADARYSDRRYTTHANPPLTNLTVGRANPFFVSPNGAASNTIAYSFQNEAGGLKSTGEVQSRSVSIGAKVKLPGDWRLDAYAVHAEELQDSLSTNVLNSAYLNEALGNIADNPLTAYSAGRDGYFNPFIGQGRNRQAILDFVTSGFEKRHTVGRLDTASLTADGALLGLPAGEVRLALGAQVRTEGLKSVGRSLSSAVAPVAAFSRRGERDVSALFAEARVPLFGPAFRRPGLERLEVSMALRREHYEGGATSVVPKLGVIWSPVGDLALKATYGESFRAPSLGELTDPQQVTPVNIANGGASVLTLLRIGGNPNLRPETAKSWTAGFELTPASRPGARVTASLFDTKFSDRIGQPAINNLTTVLTAPDLAPFRAFVNPASNPADLALIQTLLTGASAAAAALFPATAYQAIADARYVNTGSFEVRGLDVTGAYGFSVAGDPVTLSANVSWLMSYERKITASAQSVEQAGVVENPADLRARLSGSWTHGAVTTTLGLNHVGDLSNPAGPRVHAQTTADLQLQYASAAKTGAGRGVVMALTVQNLLDQRPPFYDSRAAVGYDPANYDPNGRLIALQLTKAW
ncbi:MAG: TonB-dependent receptor [Caulobacter sp.]|nr:TonB-dependent receptor [Caulobacter sp.]